MLQQPHQRIAPQIMVPPHIQHRQRLPLPPLKKRRHPRVRQLRQVRHCQLLQPVRVRPQPLRQECIRQQVVLRHIQARQRAPSHAQQLHHRLLAARRRRVRQVEQPQPPAALLRNLRDLAEEPVVQFPDLLQPERRERRAAVLCEGLHAVEVEPRTLRDQEGREQGVCGEEGLPGVDAHEEGPEELDVRQRGQGGGERAHGDVVQVPAEVEPELREVGVEVGERGERWGGKVYYGGSVVGWGALVAERTGRVEKGERGVGHVVEKMGVLGCPVDDVVRWGSQQITLRTYSPRFFDRAFEMASMFSAPMSPKASTSLMCFVMSCEG